MIALTWQIGCKISPFSLFVFWLGWIRFFSGLCFSFLILVLHSLRGGWKKFLSLSLSGVGISRVQRHGGWWRGWLPITSLFIKITLLLLKKVPGKSQAVDNDSVQSDPYRDKKRNHEKHLKSSSRWDAHLEAISQLMKLITVLIPNSCINMRCMKSKGWNQNLDISKL